ncbi:hypothetical protein MLD38_005682 [Melastoma candidum]|uniref:Uncharacterized protein n=1 Tax=Melastoma candidum TaxID=119954 RepID=A0ACB9RTW2_9MYRT|nr:hypothetical protein MLD38_005682 [Melastoma candidum]
MFNLFSLCALLRLGLGKQVIIMVWHTSLSSWYNLPELRPKSDQHKVVSRCSITEYMGIFREICMDACKGWGTELARKGVCLHEDASELAILEKIKDAYDCALEEHLNAGRRYEEALKVKPDFFEASVALGQQEFEQAQGSNVMRQFKLGTRCSKLRSGKRGVPPLFRRQTSGLHHALENS